MARPIAQAAREMLTGQILPFWSRLRDDEFGGFYGYMDYELQLDPKAEKGCILNSRILWFFSEAAALLKDEQAARQADHAFRFLMDHCVDRINGGIYWSLHYDGTPADTTKHTYNQAFAIYALSAYYRLTGNEQALALANELFRIIETRCTDDEGYLEAFTVDWKPESNEKLSENGVMADKTMNTLLHVFEGYAGLYQASPSSPVEQALRRILKIYAEKIYDPKLRRQTVFFDAHYNSLLDLHSYGHDIESSWLIDWGCGLLGDEQLSRSIGAINSVLADEILHTAYRDHSVCNEAENGKVDTTRVWWVQAEAILGFVNAWKKEPQRTEYRDAAADIWHYIETVMVDKRPGSEWFWSVDAEGNPHHKPIVEPWKCPYHNGRMCMELIRRNPDVQV
ncbi:AGE family epimerase/isomerase [Allofournierella massiliensis]|uniref:Cellobiose 2-epimerase n=1 Tax=Allofournierella massiliensis TaxID=1650663 RepID=A0ABT7UQ13_9FIRM|nr:AGE family epimerase/isomerase [Fournierella massiliensis]MDM8200979.1 AGE family epimerase/isomerase [Fournierella massiliensis]